MKNQFEEVLMEKALEEEFFGKCVYEATKEDVIKSIINHPEQWTKEQLIEFILGNF